MLTKYQVFELQGAVWGEKGQPVEAVDGKRAIKAAAIAADGTIASGRFFAVPVRNITVADLTTRQEPSYEVTEASWTD